MKYTIELGKIIEGALKYDQVKVKSYTQQLINKLLEDGEVRSAEKFSKMLSAHNEGLLSPMGTSKENNIPVDIESRTTMADLVYPLENNSEVILSNNNSSKIQSFVLSYKNADKLKSLGVDVSNTLLLYGPPGCGKTKCAYLIAKELGLPLVIARLDSIISSYLGTTSKNIRTLFEYTQKMPCVLFLDEFDALAKARDDNNELGELKRVVNSLLQNIDAMSNDSLLLAATNHEKLLDTAVWRRFDYKLEIELPDHESINKMLELFIGKNLEMSEKDIRELSYAFEGMSGASIEEVVKKAIRNSIIFDNTLTKTEIYDELFTFVQIFSTEKEKELTKRKAKYLRQCNEKIFSYSVIADILNVSKTKVSTLLAEEDK